MNPRTISTVLTVLVVIASGAGYEMKAQGTTSFIKVAPDLYFYYTGGSSNSTVLITEEGVLVVDTLGNRQAAEAVVAEIRAITDAPIRWAINGQDHGDHYFGSPRCSERRGEACVNAK